MLKRPEVEDYAPYYSTYVNLVPDGDLLQILNNQMKETIQLLMNTSDLQSNFRYSPGKWSVKEVLGHMADTERVMSYRLLCIARGETMSLPSYDQDMYGKNSSFNKQSMHDLLENVTVVRQSTLHSLKSLDSEAWSRRGNANQSEVSVRALVYIIAGHELHHRQIIQERYMGSNDFPS